MEELLEIYAQYNHTVQVAEAVYRTLYDAIIQNLLPSGERLGEEKLAEFFDVSRTPVREAIKRLECEDFVTYDLKYGYQVRSYTNLQCVELFEALEYMRQMTTRIAAETITRPNLLRLGDNLEKTRAALDVLPTQDNSLEIIALFEDFHRIVAQSIQNEALYRCYCTLDRQYAFILSRHPHSIYNKDAIRDHVGIYEALAARDRDRAWELALLHTENTSMRIKQFLF